MTFFKSSLIAGLVLLFSFPNYGQVGIGTNSPNPSAQLEVRSTNKGFLPPSLALQGTNDAQLGSPRIASPATGLLVYNTATAGTSPNNVTPGFYYYDGAKWQRIINQQPDATVSFNTADPNTGSPTFTPSNAASTDFIYVSSVNNSQWTWNGTAYVTYTPQASTPWMLSGSTNDAGSNKSGSIYRSGNVGIGTGTTAPTAGLEILTDGSQLNALRVTSNQAYSSSPDVGIGFRFKFNTAGDYTSGAVISGIKENTTDGNQSGSLRFMTNSAGTIAERMRISSSGNVGIGTSNPTTISNYISQTINGTSGSFTEYQENGSNAFRIGSDIASGGFLNQTNANPIRIFTNSSERMRITSGGNVGIGTTSPTPILDIQGGVPGDASFGQVYIADTRAHNTSGLGGTISLGATFSSSIGNTYLTSIQGAKENATEGNYSGAMIFSTRPNGAGLSERMRITSGGNVGIGTTSPGSRFHVKSNGTIMRIEGTDHAYLEIFPQGSSTRYGYIGYPVTLSNDLFVSNENSSGNLVLSTSNTERLRILSTGQVGIGRSPSASYILDLNGDMRANSTVYTSDARLKTILNTWSNDDQIDFVQYRWKTAKDSREHYGYLAQDVQKVLPDAVYADSDGIMAVNYDEVHSYKLALQEKRIKDLEQTVDELKKIIKRKRSRRKA